MMFWSVAPCILVDGTIVSEVTDTLIRDSEQEGSRFSRNYIIFY